MVRAGASGQELTKTVLVADMVESTRFLADMGSKQAERVRHELFSIFAEEIAAEGGDLIKTMGDGCLATFASSARAVDAGLAMHRAALRLGRRVVPVQLRIGLAVGDVTVEDSDVHGMPVVLAARLCSAAAPLQVLVTQAIVDLASDRGGHRYVSVGSLELKGIPNPVACSEVVGAPREDRPPLASSLERGANEVLVGRDAELTRLRVAWKTVVADESHQLVLVHGDPGVGKSRLAAAVAREVHPTQAIVLLGRCEVGRDVPYEPLQAPLRDLIAFAERSVLRAHVDACGGELCRIVPELAERLDRVPDPEPGDAGVERDRLFDAVTDLLARCAREAPILLIVEDIHWGARSTLHLLDHLTGSGAPRSLLVVATYRDSKLDRTPDLDELLAAGTTRGSLERIPLAGLDEAEMVAMVAELSGDELDEEGELFVRSLHEQTSGNPFFAGQVLRHLIERGDLQRDGDRWRTSSTTGIDLPDGVLEVVGHRLARLAPQTREILPVAAVLGQRFGVSDLRLVAPTDELGTLVASLDEACDARLLADAGPGRFTFNHAIVREALLAQMSSTGRAVLHLKIADALAGPDEATPRADVRVVAEHYLQAAVLGDAGPAGRFALEGAAASLWQADNDGARRLLERAADAVEACQPVDHELLHDLLVTLLWVLLSRLDPDFRDVMPRAADAARHTGVPKRLAAVALCVTGMSSAGEPDPETTGLLQEALDWLGDDDSAMRAYLLASVGFAELLASRQVGITHVDEALAIADRLEGTDDEILAQARVLAGFASVGRPGAAERLRSVEAAMAASPGGGDWRTGLRRRIPLMMASVLGPEVRGLARLASGDRAAFEQSFEELCDIATRTGTALALGWSHQWRCMLALLDGRFDEAPALSYAAVEAIPTEANYALGYQAQLLWQSIEQGAAGNTVAMLRFVVDTNPGIPAFRSSLAVAYLLAGDIAAARAETEGALDDFPTYARNWLWPQTAYQLAEVVCTLEMRDAAAVLLDELDPYEGELLVVGPGVYVVGAYDRVRGMLRSLVGDHDAAVDCLRAGLRLEERVHGPPLVARTSYWLARALRAREAEGDRAEADALAARGHEIASSLGMVALTADIQSLLAG